jgi:hypothetical protein
MNKTSCLILSGAILLQVAAGAQTWQNGYSQNPYNNAPVNPYHQGEEYQMQRSNQSVDIDFPPSSPSSQGEESFMQNAERRYQQETQSNLNMIRRDRSMMEKEYDPNQTFNYGQKGQFQNQTGQQQDTVAYPTNNPPENEKGVLNDAESRLRGGYSNQDPQYRPETFRNPYENQPRSTKTNH